jgi:hypothetical protein
VAQWAGFGYPPPSCCAKARHDTIGGYDETMAPARKVTKKPGSKKAASRKTQAASSRGKTASKAAGKKAAPKKKTSKAVSKKAASKKTAPRKKAAPKKAAPKKKASKGRAAPKAVSKAGAKKKATDPARARRAPTIRSRKAKTSRGTPPTLTGGPPRKNRLGEKWVCFSCEAKFYDLNAPEPLCPKCGTDQREKPKSATPTPAKRAKKRGRRGRSRDSRSLAPYLDDDDGSTRKESLTSEDMELEFGGVATDDEPGEANFDDPSVVVDTVSDD